MQEGDSPSRAPVVLLFTFSSLGRIVRIGGILVQSHRGEEKKSHRDERKKKG